MKPNYVGRHRKPDSMAAAHRPDDAPPRPPWWKPFDELFTHANYTPMANSEDNR